MAKKVKASKFHVKLPAVIHDVMSYARFYQLAVEADIGVKTVQWGPWSQYLHAVEIMPFAVSEPNQGAQTRWAVVRAKDPVKEAELLKAQGVRHGATPEAVRLLKLVIKVTKEEELIMAEKLKSKTAAKEKPAAKAPTKGDTEGLKTAAKKTPVAPKAEGEAPKKKGNPEALQKAREARAAGAASVKSKKIKALKKPKDIEARDGSFRKKMLEDILRAKTVGEFYEIGEADGRKYDSGCVRFAEQNGYVSLS